MSSSSSYKKYLSPACDNRMSFHDCELAILRQAVDESEEQQGAKVANSPEVVEIIRILEKFLARKKLICYGGTAINNILPRFAQFYDRSVDVPDYDFFSKNALRDAKELADLYFSRGYAEVEAKSGMHPGTFKVFVNFIPVADITMLHPVLFGALEKEAMTIAGIRYAPPNYLRMGMFLELSRPQGDVSRWEKVLKRMTLLNKYYPLDANKPGRGRGRGAATECGQIDFQRGLDLTDNADNGERLYYLARDALIDQGVVFFGGYGASLYSKYMPAKDRRQVNTIPDFDVLAEDPEHYARILKERLVGAGFEKVQLVVHTAIGEVIPYHVQVIVAGDTIAILYKPLSCHSYNAISVNGKEVRVATVDTMLSLFLAFLYGDKPYFDKDRILCMAMYLFGVQQRNRLEQRGLLKRFSMSCYGKQESFEEIRAAKTAKFAELKNQRGKAEYDYWFLKYNPAESRAESRAESSAESSAESRAESSAESRAESSAESRAKSSAESSAESRAESRTVRTMHTSDERKQKHRNTQKPSRSRVLATQKIHESIDDGDADADADVYSPPQTRRAMNHTRSFPRTTRNKRHPTRNERHPTRNKRHPRAAARTRANPWPYKRRRFKWNR